MGKIQNIDGKKFYYNKEEVYEALIKTSKDFIVIGNLKTGIFKYPVEIAKVLDLPSQIIEDPVKYWKNIILEEDWEKFYKSNENFMSGKESFHHVDFRIRNKKNEIVWLKCIGNMMRDKNGIPSTFVGMISLHEKNNKIDPVTRLFVIEEFFKSLEAKLENPPENLGVLILGINNFKRINEFYGRETGDIILRRISGIIQDVIPYRAEVYKLDGTNFGIILEDTSREEIEKIYEIIKDKFEEKQIVSKNEDILAVSVGVAMYPDDGQSYKELYQYAKYSICKIFKRLFKKKRGKFNNFFL
ncbi:MAG: sensor domain-containing diguanylate cyclase [Fusobacterium sp.]